MGHMDNIILKKIYDDNGFIEIKVIARNDFIYVWQTCYVSVEILSMVSKKINDYLDNCFENCYIEIGSKNGNCTPAFSIEILMPNNSGHLKLELDMEISDNKERKHRCKFYIKTEIGLIERFGKKILELATCEVGDEISLIE